jgi:hypothetical protein
VVSTQSTTRYKTGIFFFFFFFFKEQKIQLQDGMQVEKHPPPQRFLDSFDSTTL